MSQRQKRMDLLKLKNVSEKVVSAEIMVMESGLYRARI